MATTITRIWHGKTNALFATDYLLYIEETGVQDLRRIPGNLGAQILRRIEGELCHFWVISKWESLESIKAFAGEDFEKARYYEEDKKYLLEFEENVIHCETFDY